jgi:hypothetical protein
VASGDASLYSEALRRVKGNWSDELLDQFLRDPAAMVPGTAMPFEGIPECRAEAGDRFPEGASIGRANYEYGSFDLDLSWP